MQFVIFFVVCNEWCPVAYIGGGPRCDAPLLARPWKFFKATLYEKNAFFAVFQQELQNSTMFDGLFSYRYNLRLKSPCEIASDMTLWFSAFPNFRKNGRICGFHWTFKSKKRFSFRGAPPDPWPGALPLDPAGGSAARPRYRLALCALAMPPFAKS